MGNLMVKWKRVDVFEEQEHIQILGCPHPQEKDVIEAHDEVDGDMGVPMAVPKICWK